MCKVGICGTRTKSVTIKQCKSLSCPSPGRQKRLGNESCAGAGWRIISGLTGEETHLQQHTHRKTLKPPQILTFCWTSDLLIQNSYLEVQLIIFSAEENASGNSEKEMITHQSSEKQPGTKLTAGSDGTETPWLLIPATSKELNIPNPCQQQNPTSISSMSTT